MPGLKVYQKIKLKDVWKIYVKTESLPSAKSSVHLNVFFNFTVYLQNTYS